MLCNQGCENSTNQCCAIKDARTVPSNWQLTSLAMAATHAKHVLPGEKTSSSSSLQADAAVHHK
jgi:hypothetical protein